MELAEYLKRSTEASGVPLIVEDEDVLLGVAQMLMQVQRQEQPVQHIEASADAA